MPPTTMPAMTVNASVVLSDDADALSTREVSITPARPAAVPLNTNVRMRIAVDADAREPRGLGVARRPRTCSAPAVVRARMTPSTSDGDRPSARSTSSRRRTPCAQACRTTDRLKRTTRLPFVIRLAMPLTTNDIASVAISELIRRNVVTMPLTQADERGGGDPERRSRARRCGAGRSRRRSRPRARRSRRPRGRCRRRRGRASRRRRSGARPTADRGC